MDFTNYASSFKLEMHKYTTLKYMNIELQA